MEFGVLGPLEVRRGAHVVRLRGPKQRALLVTLLLNANRVVPAERLIDDLWGEELPQSGEHALRVRVAELRKALAVEGEQSPISTRPLGYVMLLRRDQLDLLRFEDRLERGSNALADGDLSTASAELRAALELWRGPALADVRQGGFGRSAALRLEELRLHALELRIEAELSLGQHEQLVSELRSLVEDHPLNERLRAQLMRALYGTGRQSEALDAYRAGRERLVSELGIEPSPALQALERDILRHDPLLDAPVPATTSSPEVASLLERSLLVLASDEVAIDVLLSLAEPMARRPPHELILMRLVDAENEVPAVVASLHERRSDLVERRVAARAAAFASANRGADAALVAREQAVDLVLADLAPSAEPFRQLSPDTLALLEGAPCDVALLRGRGRIVDLEAEDSVIVPFGAADHDWTAVELAAWICKAHESRLQLAGVGQASDGRGRDLSRMLARASLLLQKTLDITADPLLVAEGADAFIEAVADAALVVVGLSSHEGRRDLGSVRLALLEDATPPVLLVREGLRPGGLAPRETLTCFSWSMSVGESAGGSS